MSNNLDNNNPFAALVEMAHQSHADHETIKALIVIIALLVFLSVGLMWALAEAVGLVW